MNSFKLYLSKLSPKINALFQRPNPKFNEGGGEDVWYIADNVGVNTIGKFLSVISERSNLKTRYTNHCLRGTTATAMKKQGFSITEIASVTKHRNQESLKHYLDLNSFDDKTKYSSSLFDYIKEVDESSSSSLSCHPEENTVENNRDYNNDDEEENWNIEDMTGSNDDDDDDDEISFKPRNKVANCKLEAKPNTEEIVISKQGEKPESEDIIIENIEKKIDDSPSPSKRKINDNNATGLFGGAQLSNCTIHINVTN